MILAKVARRRSWEERGARGEGGKGKVQVEKVGRKRLEENAEVQRI